jgi:hypothetical protein
MLAAIKTVSDRNAWNMQITAVTVSLQKIVPHLPTLGSPRSVESLCITWCQPWVLSLHCPQEQLPQRSHGHPEGPANAHIQALNLTEGICAPAIMAWLAWCKVFRRSFEPPSRHGFFVVSRFVFCQQILSAEFYRQQICILSADSVNRFLWSAVLTFARRMSHVLTNGILTLIAWWRFWINDSMTIT